MNILSSVNNFNIASKTGKFIEDVKVKHLSSNHVGVNFNKKKAIYCEFNATSINPFQIKNNNANIKVISSDKEIENNNKKEIVITSLNPKAYDYIKQKQNIIEIKVKNFKNNIENNKINLDNPINNRNSTKLSINNKIEDIKKEIFERKEYETKIKKMHLKSIPNNKITINNNYASPLYITNNSKKLNLYNNLNNNLSLDNKDKCFRKDESYNLYKLDDNELANYYLKQSRLKVKEIVDDIESAAKNKKEVNGFTMSSIDFGKKKLTCKIINNKNSNKLKNNINNTNNNNNINNNISCKNLDNYPYENTCTYDKVLTNAEYKKQLFHNFYPYVDYELLPKERDVFIPVLSLDKVHTTRKNEIIKVKPNYKFKFYSNFNDKFKKYEKDLDSFGDKALISASSEYVSNEKQRRLDHIKSKSKWISNRDFRSTFNCKGALNKCNDNKDNSKIKLDANNEYNRIDYNNLLKINMKTENKYTSILDHRFRDVNKDKWIGKSFRFKY